MHTNSNYIDNLNADFFNINRNDDKQDPNPCGYANEQIELTIDITDEIKARDKEKKEKAEARKQKAYEEKITDQANKLSNGQQQNGFKLKPETREQTQKQKSDSPIISGAGQGWSL